MAQTITRSISIDVAQENRLQPIVAKQYDRASRFLNVQFLDMGTEMTIEQGATIVINAKRSDGQGLSFSGSVNSDGTVRVPITYWMLELDGPVVCDISIITGSSADTMLTSTSFTLEVQAAAVTNADVEENEDYPVLLELIHEVSEFEPELLDIRNGVHGQTFNSAGDAVRASAEQLYNMKTGFDGVTYQTPVQMVNSCDQKLQDEIDGIDERFKESLTFLPVNFTPSVGAYSLVTKELYTHQNYRNILIKNFGIAAIKVNGISESNIPLVAFYSGIPSASTFISYYGNVSGPTTYTDEVVLIPDDTEYIAVSSYISTTTPIKVEIASNKTVKTGSSYSYTIQTGGGYSSVSKTWYASADFKAALISCSEGDAFVITTTTNGSIHLAIAYKGDPSEANFIDNYLANGNNLTSYKDTIIIAPKGCTKMAINGYKSNDLLINHANYKYIEPETSQAPISYSMVNDNLTFSNAYGDSTFSVTFGKGGVNQLPDFLSIQPMGYSRITDWFAPFVIAAKSNIDGDHTGSYYFTGGNHGYDNSGSTTNNTATGRCTALSFFADGKKLSNGDSGSCSEIDIRWTNRIQAFNTSKSDGTGREVLEEIHTLHYDGYEMRCDTVLNPLEAIHVVKWYGYQGYISSAWPTVTYIGGVNRTPFTYSEGIASGNATPNEAICQSSTNQLEIEIDRSFDLGKGDLYEGTEGMFTSGSKIYCYIIADNDLASGAHYGLRGWYRFRPIS